MLKTIVKLDQEYVSYFESIHSKKLSRIIHIITVSPLTIYTFLLIYDYLFLRSQYLLFLIISLIICIVVVGLKQVIKRKRPVPISGKLFNEMLKLMPDNYSFPSAHTFSMFLIVPFSFYIFSYFGILFFLYAIFIAFTRMYLRFHYFSDVITGATLGLISGFAMLIVFHYI